jgi:sterol desaturase/sphingolipid hydroxylase (fatty acid hydroxylase superfamily)
MYFDVRWNLTIVAGIAVLGPAAMIAMDRLAARFAGRAPPRVGVADVWFMASFVIATGMLATAAQLAMFGGRAIPLDLGVRPLEMIAFTTALMLVVDTNGFFWHRFSHRNPRAFRAFHSGHHRTKGDVHIAVAFHSNTVWDYPLHSGLALSIGLSLLVLATGHYPAVTIGYATSVYVLGVAATHSGLPERGALRYVMFGMLLPIKIVPTAIRLDDHHRHHARGNCNYGVFFSHWDRAFGTWRNSSHA